MAVPAAAQAPGNPAAPAARDTLPSLSRAADAGASVPPLVFRSALQAHRPLRDQALGDWRALNDDVSRIGGWRTYLRQAQEAPPEAAPATGADQPPEPAAALPTHRPEGGHSHGHQHHRMHGAGSGAPAPGAEAPATTRSTTPSSPVAPTTPAEKASHGRH